MSEAVVQSFNTPPSAVAGQAFSCSLTLRNAGTDTWVPAAILNAASGVKLGSYPHDVTAWGPTRVLLPPPSVAPGSTVVIPITAVAPQTPGPQQRMQWQLVNEGVAWFGAIADAFVDVLPAPPPVPTPLSVVLTRARPTPGDPSSGRLAAGSNMPYVWNSGSYAADGQWRTQDFVNDADGGLAIAQSYLWTGIQTGGVCDTHVQATLVDADGAERLLNVIQWDHYAEPTSFQGRFLKHDGVILMPDEIVRFGWFTAPMGGKKAQHVGNLWVLRR